MAIQTNRLPLSPPDHDALKAVLGHAGFQVLKRVVAMRSAIHTIEAGEEMAKGNAVEADEAAGEARKYNAAADILNGIEEGSIEAGRMEIRVG